MKKKDEKAEAKQTAAFSVVMMGALLFLAVVLARSAAVQLRSGRTVSGCISLVGALLFAAVSVTMMNDLRKKRQASKTQEE